MSFPANRNSKLQLDEWLNQIYLTVARSSPSMFRFLVFLIELHVVHLCSYPHAFDSDGERESYWEVTLRHTCPI